MFLRLSPLPMLSFQFNPLVCCTWLLKNSETFSRLIALLHLAKKKRKKSNCCYERKRFTAFTYSATPAPKTRMTPAIATPALHRRLLHVRGSTAKLQHSSHSFVANLGWGQPHFSSRGVLRGNRGPGVLLVAFIGFRVSCFCSFFELPSRPGMKWELSLSSLTITTSDFFSRGGGVLLQRPLSVSAATAEKKGSARSVSGNWCCP